MGKGVSKIARHHLWTISRGFLKTVMSAVQTNMDNAVLTDIWMIQCIQGCFIDAYWV
jgi:hypothetical protein